MPEMEIKTHSVLRWPCSSQKTAYNAFKIDALVHEFGHLAIQIGSLLMTSRSRMTSRHACAGDLILSSITKFLLF